MKPLALKKEHPALKTMKFQIFFYFCGSFFALDPGSGSGSGFRMRIRIHWPNWIRIQSGSGYGSGSETLGKWSWNSSEKRSCLSLCTWLASTWQVSAPASLESQEYVTLEVAKERDRQFFSQCVSSPEKTQVYISSGSFSYSAQN